MWRCLPVVLALFAIAPGALAATIVDSRGERHFDETPRRVVALSWSMVEQVVELDIVPVGVADVDGYETWVVRPELPEGVASVGLRNEPNIERIAELRPDVILISDDQISFADRLERVAPVLHFATFRADHDNQAASRRVFLDLARLFDREDVARRRLAELDEKLAELSARIAEHFDGKPPRVTVVRFLDKARVVVHGDNAMPVFALEALGIESGFPLPASDWGIAQRKTQDLGAIDEGVVVHIEPFPEGDELFAQPLWKAMPFVRAGRFHAVPSTWTYGGALSVGNLAEALAEVLLEIDPE